MKQNQVIRGIMLILLASALISLLMALPMSGSLFSEEMTHQEFMMELENGTVKEALIEQNREAPTGTVTILTTDGTRREIAVSDVGQAERLFSERKIDYRLENVPQENYLMSILLQL